MKAIALISYIFPPYNSIASERSVKLVDQFLEVYDLVYVFTLHADDIPVNKRDDNYNSYHRANARVKIVEVPLERFGYEDPKKAFLLQKVISGFITRVFWSNGIFWYVPLKKALRKLLVKEEVDMMFVTGPPFLSFSLISKLGNKFNVPYILDYRDLWTANPRTPAFNFTRGIIKRALEQKAMGGARKVLTVSDGCAISLKYYLNGDESSVQVLKNLPDKKYVHFFRKNYTFSNQVSKEFQLVITGSIYPTCSLWPILESIKLCDSTLINQLSIQYYGGSSALVEKEFHKYKMSYLLSDHGHVSKESSIRALENADILISLVDDGRNGYNEAIAGVMTTKIFDYFLSGKPILNIGPNVSDINAFAKQIRYQHFFSFEASDTSQIAKFLQSVPKLTREVETYNIDNMPLFEDNFLQVKEAFNKCVQVKESNEYNYQ